MTFIAIIPARSGSKGIKNKNILPLNGKPLIAWTIIQALDVKRISRVILSTDCEHIASIGVKYGAEVPGLRPQNLSGDKVATEEVLIHAVENWCSNNRPESIILLQPTSPLRSENSIDDAIDLYLRDGADSLVSVTRISPFIWRNAKGPIALYDMNNRKRRQDLEEDDFLFQENGAIYITKTHTLLEKKNRLGGKIVMYEMPAEESMDIDTITDFTNAEKALKK